MDETYGGDDLHHGNFHVVDHTTGGSQKKTSEFQDRMSQFADSFIPQQPNTIPSDSAFTLGPLITPETADTRSGGDSSRISQNKKEEGILVDGMMIESINGDNALIDKDNKNENKASDDETIENNEECWRMDNAAFDGQKLHVKEDVVDVSSCKSDCQQQNNCQFFSYESASRQCSMFDKLTPTKESEGVVSGSASNCSSPLLSNNTNSKKCCFISLSIPYLDLPAEISKFFLFCILLIFFYILSCVMRQMVFRFRLGVYKKFNLQHQT